MTSLFYYLSRNFWDQEGDPRVKSYALFRGGPDEMLSIMALYLIFVKFVGPLVMKHRAAFELRKEMIVYNFILVAINAYFLVEMVYIMKFGAALLQLDFPDNKDNSVNTLRNVKVLYYYYLTKFIDLLDTIFFVLRKKNNQVSII